MAFGTQILTISAVAVSVAACLAGTCQSRYEDRSSTRKNLLKEEVRKEQKSEIVGKTLQGARFAPEFDGLYCFETLVAR